MQTAPFLFDTPNKYYGNPEPVRLQCDQDGNCYTIATHNAA